MRRLWLAVLLAMPLTLVGCRAKSPAMLSADKALEDCSLAKDGEARMALEIAGTYFKRVVEVEIASMRMKMVSVCEARLVIPIEATTVHTKTSRLWFVEIDRNNPQNVNLIRPE
jgi:hypothetical protein